MHDIALGQGHIIRWSQFQAINEAFTNLAIAVNFRKKTALNSDLYRFFHDFIYAEAGADNSNGVNFEHHRKL